MFEEEYNKLTSRDQDNFKAVISSLFVHTYILRSSYDFSEESIRRDNQEFIFARRNIEMISDYLAFAGCTVSLDDHYGIIYLSSFPDGSRVRFDKMTTLVLYSLRLIYEEEREKLTLGTEVPLTVRDLNQKLISLGVTKDGRPLVNYLLRDILSRLARFRIIVKGQGSWDEYSTRFVILPSILLSMVGSQIKNLEALIEEKGGEDSTDEES